MNSPRAPAAMDFYGLSELVMFSFLGLTVFIAVIGITLRFVLGPFLRDLIEAYRERSLSLPEHAEVLERLDRLERHLVEMDTDMDELRQAARMDRLLQRPESGESVPRS